MTLCWAIHARTPARNREALKSGSPDSFAATIQPMDAEHLRQFANRSWEKIAAEKQSYLCALKEKNGSAWALSTVMQLREDALRRRPDFDASSQQGDDLDNHVRLKKLFDRAYEKHPNLGL